MNSSPFHCAAGGGEGLPKDLSTEDLGRANVTTLPAKNVLLDGLEFEQGDEVGEAVTHAGIVPGLC